MKNQNIKKIILLLLFGITLFLALYHRSKLSSTSTPPAPSVAPPPPPTITEQPLTQAPEAEELQAVPAKEKVAPTSSRALENKTEPKTGPKKTPAAIDSTTNHESAKEPVFTDSDADELDKMLDNANKFTKASAARALGNPNLEDKIATDQEKQVVQQWQQTTIEKAEEKKAKDWASYHTSLEAQLSGLWQMGDSGAIAFYKDGTGQVSFVRDDKKEQTLTGNFFFRYTIDNNNIVKIIPILTKDSERKITANFVTRIDGNKLLIGPYRYTNQGKKK